MVVVVRDCGNMCTCTENGHGWTLMDEWTRMSRTIVSALSGNVLEAISPKQKRAQQAKTKVTSERQRENGQNHKHARKNAQIQRIN